MKKHSFDTRTLQEVVEEIKSLKTSQGDSTKLLIYYGNRSPRVWLRTSTFDPDKKHFHDTEEISDWVDKAPNYQAVDDTTGLPLPGEFKRGFSTWEEYMNNLFIPSVRGIMNTGGRSLDVEILEKPLDE